MTLILVGNYGDGNVGDEALREFFLSAFPEYSWRVVSARPSQPSECWRLPLGFRSLFSPWWRTIRDIARADALVFGGGTLFTDTESLSACFLWALYALIARVFRVPVVLAYQGIGPFRTTVGRWIFTQVLRSAAFISVRDEASLQRVAALSPRAMPLLTFDPAFAAFASYQRPLPSRNVFALIPRHNATPEFFALAKERSTGAWDDVVILLMQPSRLERDIAERLKAAIGSTAHIVPLRTVRELMTHVSAASLVLTQRYHGALASLAMGVRFEVVPQASRDKLAEIAAAASPELRARYLAMVDEGSVALRRFFSQL